MFEVFHRFCAAFSNIASRCSIGGWLKGFHSRVVIRGSETCLSNMCIFLDAFVSFSVVFSVLVLLHVSIIVYFLWFCIFFSKSSSVILSGIASSGCSRSCTIYWRTIWLREFLEASSVFVYSLFVVSDCFSSFSEFLLLHLPENSQALTGIASAGWFSQELFY